MTPRDVPPVDVVRADLVSPDPERRRQAIEHVDVLPVSEAREWLVGLLGDGDWRVRKAAVSRLCASDDVGPVARALLDALGDGDNPGRRNSAVEALVALGKSVVPVLVAACDDEDADVRKFIVDSLAGIGDSDAVEALTGRLADPDANVRAATVDALGAIGGDEVREPLIAVAVDGNEDALVRFSALHALDALEVPMRFDEIEGVFEEPMLGPAGLALLGRRDDDPAAFDALLAGLESPVRAARESCMRGLLRLVDGDCTRSHEWIERIRRTADARPEMVGSTLERLPDADLGTRMTLVQFLGLVGADEAVLPVLELAHDEALVDVVGGALRGMGDAAGETLEGSWNELDPDQKRIACGALGSTRKGIGRLLGALGDPDPRLRMAAAMALAEAEADEALAPLVRQLEQSAAEDDPDGEREREVLVEALAKLTGSGSDAGSSRKAQRAVELLSGAWSGSGDAVREALALAFGRVARAEDAPTARSLQRDPCSGVRRVAVETLARLEGSGALDALRLAAADESAAVRVAAARALGGVDEPVALEDLCRLAADDSVRVRAAAVRGVGRGFAADADATRRAAAQALLQRACSDEVPVALAVVEAAAPAGGIAVAYVASLLSRPEPELVSAAVRCVGKQGAGPELDALLPLVSHSDWSVRAEAIELLAAREVGKAVPTIRRQLEAEQDDSVRRTAAAALKRLGG